MKKNYKQIKLNLQGNTQWTYKYLTWMNIWQIQFKLQMNNMAQKNIIMITELKNKTIFY